MLLEGRIGGLIHAVDPTPLSGALQIAAIQVQALHHAQSLKEEDFTAALLGSFAATIPWLAHAFEKDILHPFDWASYSKNSQSIQGEGSTGADFALLVHISDCRARAAIFQSKLCKDGNSLDVHQISPTRTNEDKLPQPQIIRLADHGLDVMGPGSTESELNWVHYCGYSTMSSFCIPLSSIINQINEHRIFAEQIHAQLENYINELKEGGNSRISEKSKKFADTLWADFKKVKVKRNPETIDFVHLLADGAAIEPSQNALGWRTLEGQSIRDFRQKTSRVMRIFEASACVSPSSTAQPAGVMAAVVKEINKSVENHMARIEGSANRHHTPATTLSRGKPSH